MEKLPRPKRPLGIPERVPTLVALRRIVRASDILGPEITAEIAQSERQAKRAVLYGHSFATGAAETPDQSPSLKDHNATEAEKRLKALENYIATTPAEVIVEKALRAAEEYRQEHESMRCDPADIDTNETFRL